MPVSDLYVHRSGSVSIATVTQTAVISLFGTAAKRLWVVGVRVEIGNTAAAAANNMLFTLARPGNTVNASSTNGGNPLDYSAPASIGVNATAWTTAPTVGTILAEWEVPMSSGSMWVEYPPTNYEWGVPAIANDNANAGVHVFVTASVATSTPIFVDIIESE